MNDVAMLITALGGLGGLGALIANLATLAKTRRVKEDTAQLRPDHGASIADQVTRIEKHLAGLTATVTGLDQRTRAVGHQIGEIRRDLADAASEHARRLDHHDERINQLEQKRH